MSARVGRGSRVPPYPLAALGPRATRGQQIKSTLPPKGGFDETWQIVAMRRERN
jgi:hypothetical protein